MDYRERELNDSGHNLLHNLILFGRILRQLGMDVNPGRMIDLVEALEYIELGDRESFYHTLRCLLVHKHEQFKLYDQAFTLFWRKPSDFALDVDLSELLPSRPGRRRAVAGSNTNQKAPSQNHNPNAEGEEQLVLELSKTYSAKERLRHKDFGDLTAEEIEAVQRFMAQVVWKLGERRTRRFRAGRGRQPDIRRSFRRNLRYGGELLELPRRERRSKPRPLVIIADVSGSMERYTRLLLQFIYSLAEGLTQHVEAFVFSTRLTRITRQLQERELEQALRDVSRTVEDWSGGTRIGEALKVFNYQWARRVLGQGAIVMVISDGWDRGDPALLAHEMARLRRNCYRLIWLNPLLGSERYEPLTRGIRAALPHIDDFLPVHNLASLEDLAAHLTQLDQRRPGIRRPLFTNGAAFVGNR